LHEYVSNESHTNWVEQTKNFFDNLFPQEEQAEIKKVDAETKQE